MRATLARPGVPDVRFAFLIAAAVGQLDGIEAIALVEASSPVVHLERPQLEVPVGRRHREVEQPASNALRETVGHDIQVVDPAGRDPHHPDDLLAVDRHHYSVCGMTDAAIQPRTSSSLWTTRNDG